ncbi:MAG: tRNA lysidine(34) synthetase TilS [Bacteroidia bacterium]
MKPNKTNILDAKVELYLIKNLFLTFVKINAMLSEFENFVNKNRLFSRKDKLLLAMSGGIDSICLFHILRKKNYQFSVAHCNFQLRGKESDEDEAFVRKLSKRYKIPFYTVQFDTHKESKKRKLGIQETARELRYSWFQDLKKSEKFSYILTAHHQGDNTETFLINIIRSTGISGLHGISIKANSIVRPLMFTDRASIDLFIKKYSFQFREDSSNLKDDYLRNKLRHQLIPKFREIEPKIDELISGLSSRILNYETLSQNLIEKKVYENSVAVNGGSFLTDQAFDSINSPSEFLYQAFKKYGFNYNQFSAFNSLSGSRLGANIESANWKLTRERNGFFLENKTSILNKAIQINAYNSTIEFNSNTYAFKSILKSKVDFKKVNTLYFDIDKCQLPLEIRLWKNGDKMKPLGMRGNKKISDILTDKKISTAIRNQQCVLSSNSGEIMALLPNVSSEHHKITSSTTRVLCVNVKSI